MCCLLFGLTHRPCGQRKGLSCGWVAGPRVEFLALDEGLELLIDNRMSDIDGQLIKLVAGDTERCLLLDGDEDEAVDAGNALVPSGLDMVAELSAGLCERAWRRILSGLEVDDVVLADAIDAGFDLNAGPIGEVADLGLDAIQ